VKRLIAFIALVVTLASLPVVVASDTDTALADTSFPDNEAASTIRKTGNYSSSTTITITLYTVADE
jgi:hypothetical protein